MKNIDMVNHPDHYKSSLGIEVIDVIEAFTEDLSGIEAVSTANVLKYMCRWSKKNGLEDLKKAQWYLNHLIDYIEESYEEVEENNHTDICPQCGSSANILEGVNIKEDGTITEMFNMCYKCGLNFDSIR